MGFFANILGLQSNEDYDRERAERKAEDERHERYLRDVVTPHLRQKLRACEEGRCSICGPL